MNTAVIPAERTLFVSKYPSSTTLQQLKKTFSDFGNIEQVIQHGPGVCIVFDKTQSGNVFSQFQVSSALSTSLLIDGVEPYISQYLNLEQLDPEANIFIDNLDNKETQQSLRKLLAQFGIILSVKVQKSDKIGVAYIQFEKKESADKCINEQSKLGLKISKFTSKKASRDQVYISNIKSPQSATPDQLKQDLQTFCSQFGAVESLILNRNSNNGTFFAFVKFVLQESANSAVKSQSQFNNQDIQIEWVVKNNEKDIEANLFTKNLKITVTEEQLRKAYSLLVIVEDVKLLKSKQPPISNKPITQHAYLYFRSADDGKKVIDQAYNTSEIVDLYEKGVIQLSPLLPPSEVNSLLQVRKNTFQRSQYVNQPQFSSYPQPYPQQYSQQYPQQYPQQYNQQYPQHSQQYPQQHTEQYPPQHTQQYPQQHTQQYPPYPPRQHHQSNQYQNSHQRYNNNNNRQQYQKRGYQPQLPDLAQLQSMVDNGQKQQVTDQIGTSLFPKVMQVVGPKNAPIVTGILLDFENYQLTDQVRMLSDQAFLSENIRQALDLLK